MFTYSSQDLVLYENNIQKIPNNYQEDLDRNTIDVHPICTKYCSPAFNIIDARLTSNICNGINLAYGVQQNTFGRINAC